MFPLNHSTARVWNPLPSDKSSWVQSAILFQFTFCQIQQNVSYAWLVVYSECAKNNSSLHTHATVALWTGNHVLRQNQTIPADQQQQHVLFSDLRALVSLPHVSDFEERFCVMIARECKQAWRPRKCLHFFGRLPWLSLETQSTQKAIIEAPCLTRANWSLLVFGCFSGCCSYITPQLRFLAPPLLPSAWVQRFVILFKTLRQTPESHCLSPTPCCEWWCWTSLSGLRISPNRLALLSCSHDDWLPGKHHLNLPTGLLATASRVEDGVIKAAAPN